MAARGRAVSRQQQRREGPRVEERCVGRQAEPQPVEGTQQLTQPRRGGRAAQEGPRLVVGCERAVVHSERCEVARELAGVEGQPQPRS